MSLWNGCAVPVYVLYGTLCDGGALVRAAKRPMRDKGKQKKSRFFSKKKKKCGKLNAG